jgi:Spy/CpxP family protein refolding chaperone
MKKVLGSVGFVLLAWGITISFVSAQPYRGGDWWGITDNPLGLTAEQMDQIQDTVIEWQKELLPLWSSFQTKNLELRRLMRDSKADPVMVEEKTREAGELEAKIQQKLSERQAVIREVLTDEQRAQYDVQGMGHGFGRGYSGLGFGRARGGGFGWRRSPGRGLRTPAGLGSSGPRWGRGPCGMGLGRAGWRYPTE